MSAPIIEVRNLTYRYEDGALALDGVNFRLDPGETVALFGANGSGKTTFALHLNGLLRGQGEIMVAGHVLADRTLGQIRQKIGFVFQHPDDQLFMSTVLEDVAFGPLNFGAAPQEAERIARLTLAQVGMEAAVRKSPHHLSAGEKRRVALAGVLAAQPEILLLDEPTTYLDPPGIRSLVTLLQAIPKSKILITHDILFARALASRAVFFEKGRIIADGGVQQIVEQFHWDLSSLHD